MGDELDSDYIDESGRPTHLGRISLKNLADDLKAVLFGHHDNTGAPCRIDLGNALDLTAGHDACYTCNRVAVAWAAAYREG